MSTLPEDAPAPRLCHLVKWPDFNGYGFNLHADKSKVGQYIGKVDEDSPAECAGLCEGDRIIEVNGANIAAENHKQVVERIKAVENETKLLVVDNEADKWYVSRKLVVSSSQPNVTYIKTPDTRPTGKENDVPNGSDCPDNERSSLSKYETNEIILAEEVNNELPEELEHSDSLPEDINGLEQNGLADSVTEEHTEKEDSGSPTMQTSSIKTEESSSSIGSTASLPESPQSAKSSSSEKDKIIEQEKTPVQTNGNDALNLNMSVSEIKELLASRKKNDPKKFQMDWHQKYAVMQQM